MKYCEKCGKEVLDEAVICPGCGCEIKKTEPESAPVPETEEKGKKKTKGKKLFLIIGAAVLALVLLASAVIGVLFAPRELTLSDIEKTSTLGAIIKYGYPASIQTDSETDQVSLYYRDDRNVEFMGLTPIYFVVYPDEGRVAFFFPAEDGAQMYRTIKTHCEFEENLLDIYHIFSYGNDLKITTNDYDGSYVSIEILD